ncbi:MAG: cation transporter dimerization domain-containing protein [Phycisphaerae bacterium]
MVDLHLEVDPTLTVRTAHAIAHDVKALVKKRCPQVADVLVHVEPHADGDKPASEVQSGSSTQTTPSRISAG